MTDPAGGFADIGTGQKGGESGLSGSQRAGPNGEAPPAALRLRFGFDATHAEPLGTVAEGLLHAGSITLFYGPPKSGKSFLVSDLALAIAAGLPDWMGHVITRPGPILYVACEGHAGFWKRLLAASKTRGWDAASFPTGFILATGRPMLIRAEDRGFTYAPDPSSIIEALDEARRRGMAPVAIIIDTVFRSFGAGNVNASPDMNVYLTCVTALADLGYAIALVHHEIKSGGTPAGSVSLIGGTDTIVHIWRDDETGERRYWQVEMAKDDAETPPRAFALGVVQIGLDQDGRPAASCIVRDEGTAPGIPQKAKLSANQQTGMRTLQTAIKEQLVTINVSDGNPDQKGTRVASWRAVFYRDGKPGESQDTKQKAFRRIVDDLVAKGAVGCRDDFVWPTTEAKS